MNSLLIYETNIKNAASLIFSQLITFNYKKAFHIIKMYSIINVHQERDINLYYETKLRQ